MSEEERLGKEEIEDEEDIEGIKKDINKEIGREPEEDKSDVAGAEKESLEKFGVTVDSFGFGSFLTFILIVFFLLFSYLEGVYPFTAVPAYNLIGYLTGYTVIIQDYITFDILYWAGVGFLLIGLWRYKYDWWLILLVGILGTMLFFMFFV